MVSTDSRPLRRYSTQSLGFGNEPCSGGKWRKGYKSSEGWKLAEIQRDGSGKVAR